VVGSRHFRFLKLLIVIFLMIETLCGPTSFTSFDPSLDSPNTVVRI